MEPGLLRFYITDIAYLVSVVLFIIGLKGLSHPETATKGNRTAGIGMGLGILAALFGAFKTDAGIQTTTSPINLILIGIALVIGATIGLVIAKKIAMTQMPEMVSLLNGLGGASSMLIGLIEFYKISNQEAYSIDGGSISTAFALFIGSISFTGSLIAYGKLQGFLRDNLRLPAPQFVNILLLIVSVALGVFILVQPSINMSLVAVLLVVSLIYGVTFVTPIGGGDMPVVISLLNSFTGIAAAVAGLIYGNDVMVFGGILVGASGTFLSVLMCKAMNRSLMNVIIGGFGATGAAGADSGEQTVKEIKHSDLAIQMKYSQKVMIVPGYGLAVAQAQHTCKELEKLLTEEGVLVTYAIHPVAGRMPGHMNVLLAEADVEYDKLLELEQANKEMDSTDIVLVVGANDVVNPQALDDPGSSIYGMPIIDVQRAKTCVVLKRSMSAGYAGIQNPLFFKEKSRMLFGDAKASIKKLVEEMANA